MKQKERGVYVEIPINTSLEQLWVHTQTPRLHEQWDLRFSTIKHLPKESEEQPQRFLYTMKIGFGLQISGEGESFGLKEGRNGTSASSLKFWSNEWLSLITGGSGYWKYVPQEGHIQFLTWYDYDVRFGWCGRMCDRWVFRPLIGWGTAWSFDCLRLWLEDGVKPAVSLKNALSLLVTRLTLALVWMYQGMVPKLLYPNTGELEILRNSGLFVGFEENLLQMLGVGEVLFGMLFLLSNSRRLHWLNVTALLTLGLGALGSQPEIFIAPFNPFAVNVALIGLSAVALLLDGAVPTANNSIWRVRS
jgi:hypothetical protein